MSLINQQLRFGEESPTFDPLSGQRTIISRGISTVPLQFNFQIQISYTLITASSPDCNTTFTASPPQLQYRLNGSLSWTIIKAGKLASCPQVVCIALVSYIIQIVSL